MPPFASVQTLALRGAEQILVGSIEHARALSVPVCVAVTDLSGQLLAFARMDGAPLLSVTLSQDKAYTVTAFGGLPTHAWFDVIKDDPALLHGIVKSDRLVIFGGGVPVLSGTALAGAVGVSGGSAEQDRAIAEAGVTSLTVP